MGSPQIGRNTLPGNLSDSMRAGITPTTFSAELENSEENIALSPGKNGLRQRPRIASPAAGSEVPQYIRFSGA